MVTFDQLSKQCNEFLWKHLYPTGQLEFASHQHRDLVRTFFAGAFEMLIALNDRASMEPLMNEYEKMTAVSWMPDARFMPPTL